MTTLNGSQFEGTPTPSSSYEKESIPVSIIGEILLCAYYFVNLQVLVEIDDVNNMVPINETGTVGMNSSGEVKLL